MATVLVINDNTIDLTGNAPVNFVIDFLKFKRLNMSYFIKLPESFQLFEQAAELGLDLVQL